MTTDSKNLSQADLCAFVLGLVQPLCDAPDEVSVTPTEQDAGCVVTVAPDDYARLSGGRSRTMRSVSTVLTAAAAKFNTRCSLDLRSGQ